MKKYFSFIIQPILAVIIAIGGMAPAIAAVTYPVGTPAGEEVGGWFNTYFSNIFDPIGCNPGQVIRGFTNTGMLLCVTPTVVSCLPGGVGLGNSCYGSGSLQNGTTGANNTSNGDHSLFSNTTGNSNSSYGARSLYSNTSGSSNTANGYQSLYSNITGSSNIANGASSLFWNTTGSNNVANGFQSLLSNITGSNNTANGYNSLSANTLGSNNTADGYQSLGANTTGCGNIAVGYQALASNTIGSISIANGYRAGFNLISGDNNVAIGANTDFQNPIGSNQLNIANVIFGVGLNGTVGSPAGNIGIGTASPGARLEVAGQVKIVDGSQGSGKVLVSDNAGLASWSSIAPGVTATGIVGSSGSQNYLSKFGTGGLGIYISQLFDDGSNVGIGTATPGAKLEVAGQVKITGGTPGIGKVLVSDAVGLATWSPPVAGLPCNPAGIGLDNSCYGSGSLQNNTNGGSNTANGIATLFSNTTGNQNTTDGTESLFSNTSGYANTANGYRSLYSNTIGFQNTANGFGALYSNIIGNTNLANGYRAGFNLISGDNNTAIGSNTDLANPIGSNQLNIGNAIFGVGLNGTVGVPAGNIGIGTASPTTRLEVAGQIKITGGTPGAGKVLSSDATGLATWVSPASVAGAWMITGNSGTVAGTNFLGTTDAIDLVFKTNNAETVRILSSGNVGIGTATPGAKLEVAGQVKITGGTPGIGKVLISDATGLASWTSTISGATATGIIGASGSDNYLSKFGTGGLGIYISQLFDNGTNVGIGTSTPGSKLEVAGQVKITGGSPGLGKVLISDATGLASWSAAPTLTNVWSILGNSGTVAGTNFLGTTDAIDLVFKTNNAETVRILSSGNVGIGTATPGAKLEVAGQVKITGGTPGLGKILTSDATGLATWTGVVTATGINITGSTLGSTLYYNGSNWMAGTGLYNTGGNIGIGTSTPGSKLEVAGQVKITGGSPGLGKVLISDATGLASWSAAPTLTNVWSILGNSGTVAGTNFLGTTDAIDLVFKTNNAETVRILSSGNVGIGTATPGAKLEVAGNTYINGNLTVSGSLIVDKIVNRTVTNVSISGSLFPDTAAPLAYRDIGSAAQRWNNLYLSGQVTIAGGSPGLGKVLTSDASGLASWSSAPTLTNMWNILGNSGTVAGTNFLGTTDAIDLVFRTNNIERARITSTGNVGIGTASPGAKLEVAGQVKITGGSPGLGKILTSDATGLATWTGVVTATGINMSGSVLGSTLYYNGTAWTAGTGIYNTGGNIGIGTSSPSSKLTIDSGITGSGGLRLSRISSTTTPYSGPNVGLGVDASGNLVPVSNGDVVVYTAKGRNGAQPTPDPDLPNRLIGYNFNTYFAIPTSQSFVVSDGNGAGYNAPYFKENGTSGICSGGGSPYDCANPDPVVGVSASPNNSFTMTAKGSVYGYQLALGARGDAPLFARSGKFVGSQTGGLFLSDNTTPTPWQKVLTVPANHLEYFYVNIGYNSQLQTISGGGNVGIGTSFPDRRLVIASSGTTFADDPIVQIRRGFQGADGALGNTYGVPYMNIGGLENRVGSIQTIAFGYSSQSGTVRIAPAEIGFLTTSVTGNTKGDIVFANRDGTTNVAPTEVMRITSSGYVGIGTGAPSQQLEISKSMDLAPTSSATNGVIYKNNTRFIHNFAKYAPNDNNVFMGLGAGNFTMGTGILADPVFYGTENVGIGASTLAANTTGYSNTAVGHTALSANTSGYNNMAIGWGALSTNTTGYANTGIGRQTLGSNTTGYFNTAVGMSALQANIGGYYNSAVGHSALIANTTGFHNTADGYQALVVNTTGQYNTANGAQSLYKNIVGLSNTAVGYQSLYNTTVSNNTGLGVLAGSNITTGGSNIAIGYNSQVGSPTGSNQLSIGNWIYGSGGYIGVGISNPTAKLDVAGNFKLGTAGTVTTAAGVCTISATAITTTAATYTCTGVPASTAVAVHCNAGAAFTTPNTTSLYCRANGTLNQVICNTTVANSVSTTYKCMWMQ